MLESEAASPIYLKQKVPQIILQFFTVSILFNRLVDDVALHYEI